MTLEMYTRSNRIDILSRQILRCKAGSGSTEAALSEDGLSLSVEREAHDSELVSSQPLGDASLELPRMGPTYKTMSEQV